MKKRFTILRLNLRTGVSKSVGTTNTLVSAVKICNQLNAKFKDTGFDYYYLDESDYLDEIDDSFRENKKE